MVRRAGKSPPGGAIRTRPRRARSGPSSSTEPRRRPTSVASGSSLLTFAQRIRSVVVPIPSTSAPRSSSSRAITSTSPIRGTFWRTHSSSVRRQAAISGSAEFLLPSTSIRPLRRWPPSISRVDTLQASDSGLELSEIDDLVFQGYAKSISHDRATPLDEPPNLGRGCGAGVDDEVAMRRRHDRAPDPEVFESGTVDQRARRSRNAVRNVHGRPGILKDAAGAGRRQRLCPLSIRK